MKTQLLPLAIGLLSITAVITSCKKDDEDVAAPIVPTCFVSSYKNLDSKDSTVQTFDNQNRLVKSITYDETGKLLDEYDIYTYGENKMTYTIYSDPSTISYQTEYILNPNGSIYYKAEKDVDEDHGVTEYDTAFYTYDALGYNTMVVYKKEYKGAQNHVYYDTTWYTYTDGNMTSSTHKTNSGETRTDISTYTDLVDKANVINGSFLTFPNLYGKPNKNLILLETNEEGTYTTKYTYEMNAEGYMIRSRMEYVNTKYPSEYTNDLRFYYTCK